MSDTFKKNHTEIPFHEMIRFRNVIIHFYEGINIQYVWSTIKEDLPDLINKLGMILSNEFPE